MPSVKITDQLGASVEATLAPTSSLLKYAQALPAAVIQGADLSRMQALTLADPAVRSLQPGLTFLQPITLGMGAASLTIRADAAASFQVISGTLFSPDDYGDNILVPAGSCYVALGLQANTGAVLHAASGSLTFGIDAGGGASLSCYRPFSAGSDAPTLLDAIRQCIARFVLPADVDDLTALDPGSIVTIGGHGSLKFSGSANILAIANPLATVSLPSPLPAISVQQGASVTVGASWQISADYQVRVQKVDARRVRLGWYRKHASEATVTAAASAGVAAGLTNTDLFPTVMGAISSNAHADLAELQNAGLPPDQVSAIASAVQAAVSRKLEVGIAAELGSLASDEAAFLYEIDLTALAGGAADTVRAALRGDLSGLTGAALPPGITEIRSILTTANASHFSLKVNLLGIFNFTSVSKLALSGTVTFMPSTGDLVIVDQASASRIQSSAIHFGADEDRLRHVMAESFLITAAYRGSKSVISPPQLSSSHLYFKIDDRTSRDDMRSYAAVAPALSLSAPNIPSGVADFGRTSVFAEARYDDDLARALFLQADGTPRSRTDYESAGRRAIAMLVLPDGDDAFRRRPALDDALWNQMKDLGQPGFGQIFPELQAAVIGADYTAIQWWAGSMRGTAEILARMDTSTAGRQDLANHLRDVASKAHVQFGAPWGLVAMFLVSARSETSLHITGPRFVYATTRPLGAAG